MNNAVAILIALALTALPQNRAMPADKAWERAAKIETGHLIRVETTAKKKETGSFLGISGDAIRLQTSGAEISIPRTEISKVFSESKSHRLRNTLIGAGVGAAIGIVMYSTLGALIRNESGDQTGGLFAGPLAVGAALGAVLPAGGMVKIYDARQK